MFNICKHQGSTNQNHNEKLGGVVHTHNPSIQVSEALQIQGQSGLHGNTVSQKKKKKELLIAHACIHSYLGG
jgi:hypothetical protein